MGGWRTHSVRSASDFTGPLDKSEGRVAHSFDSDRLRFCGCPILRAFRRVGLFALFEQAS
jgi:hypothetical protein